MSIERQGYIERFYLELLLNYAPILHQAARECSHLDVRVLQGFLKNVELQETHLNKAVEVVIAHTEFGESEFCE